MIGSGAAILQAALARKNSRGAHFCAGTLISSGPGPCVRCS